jgi:hypothetical protein
MKLAIWTASVRQVVASPVYSDGLIMLHLQIIRLMKESFIKLFLGASFGR